MTDPVQSCSAANEHDTCKFCGTTATPNDEPNCSTLEQAYEQTPSRPYGCPWFDKESRKLHPKDRAEMSNLKDPERALVEKCRSEGFDYTAGCNLVDLVRRAGLRLTFNAAQAPIGSRFRITWDRGAYYVSIPNYRGGEVVDAIEYDRVAALYESEDRKAADEIASLRLELEASATQAANYRAQIEDAIAAQPPATPVETRFRCPCCGASVTTDGKSSTVRGPVAPSSAASARSPWDVCQMIVEEECYLDEGVMDGSPAAAIQPYGYAIRDRIKAAKAEATDLPQAAWQPIETAPHSTKVLLGWWRSDGSREWMSETGAASFGWSRNGVSNISRHGQATHWQPLPGAPELSRPHHRGGEA